MSFVMGKKVIGNVIDVVREREGYRVYVRYGDGGKVYITPVLDRYSKPQFFMNQEVGLDVSEKGVCIV